MAINFPSSPTEGQIFNNGKVRYTYRSGAWMANLIGTAQSFNLVVNPSFQAGQQNGVASGTANAYYFADQWCIFSNALAGISMSRTVATGGNGSPYRGRVAVTAALASPAAGDYMGIKQPFEGHRVMPLAYGTPYARQSILRLWVKAPAGTYGVALRKGDATRSCVFSCVISAGEANTLVPKTFIVPAETTGTWEKTTAWSMTLTFMVMCGTTYQTATLGVWQNGNFMGPTGHTNGMSSTSNSFEIGDVGWYLDPSNTGAAPQWEMRSEVDALLESMRYWYPARVGHGLSSNATTVNRLGAAHPVQMRATAALSIASVPGIFDGTVANGLTAINTSYGNQWCWEIDGTSSGMTGVRQVVMVSSSVSYIACNARM